MNLHKDMSCKKLTGPHVNKSTATILRLTEQWFGSWRIIVGGSWFASIATAIAFNVGLLSQFSFPKTLSPSFLHHLCLQFLYPTNFLVRECFSLLVKIHYYMDMFLVLPYS